MICADCLGKLELCWVELEGRSMYLCLECGIVWALKEMGHPSFREGYPLNAPSWES